MWVIIPPVETRRPRKRCPNSKEDIRSIGYTKSQTEPIKKISMTDAIFENVNEADQPADKDIETLRISIDAKTKVSIREFFRGGKSREEEL